MQYESDCIHICMQHLSKISRAFFIRHQYGGEESNGQAPSFPGKEMVPTGPE